MSEALDQEREHQDAWYARAVESKFFEREGFRRLIAWNLVRLRAVVPLTPASRVLSLGCGTGEYELALAPAVAQLTAIDLSATAIAEAERRARARGLPNVTWRGRPAARRAAPERGRSMSSMPSACCTTSRQPSDTRCSVACASGWRREGASTRATPTRADCCDAPRAGGSGILRFTVRTKPRWPPPRSSTNCDPPASPTSVTGYTDVLGGPLPWLVGSPSRVLWSAVFAVDRAWLATPGLRRLASQFDVRARR